MSHHPLRTPYAARPVHWALVLLLLAAPCWAALTEPEKRHAEIAVGVPLAVDRAEVALGWALEVGTTSKKARACLAGALEATLRVSRHADQIPAAILGAEGEARAEQLASAWVTADGMLSESLGTAQAAVLACWEHNARDGAFQGHLATAGSALDEAHVGLLSLDRTLPYADPPFEDRLRNGRRTAFGFHGDYYALQKRLLLARHYWRETALEVIGTYRHVQPGKHTSALAGAWRVYAMATSEQHRAGALLAGVAVHVNETHRNRLAALPQFSKVLEALRILQHARTGDGAGVPELYLAFLWEWAAIESTSAHYRRVLVRLGDSWAQQDEAAWQVMDREGAP